MSTPPSIAHRSEMSTPPTTGRHLQQVLHYSTTPNRYLPGLRRSECSLYDVDCDEVVSKIYLGDVLVFSACI